MPMDLDQRLDGGHGLSRFRCRSGAHGPAATSAGRLQKQPDLTFFYIDRLRTNCQTGRTNRDANSGHGRSFVLYRKAADDGWVPPLSVVESRWRPVGFGCHRPVMATRTSETSREAVAANKYAVVKHAERQREWTGGDYNKRHSDVIARERARFGLRCYWRRRPSRGEMSPPSNRTGFRPDAATTAHGPRFRDTQTGLDRGTGRPGERSLSAL